MRYVLVSKLLNKVINVGDYAMKPSAPDDSHFWVQSDNGVTGWLYDPALEVVHDPLAPPDPFASGVLRPGLNIHKAQEMARKPAGKAWAGPQVVPAKPEGVGAKVDPAPNFGKPVAAIHEPEPDAKKDD